MLGVTLMLLCGTLWVTGPCSKSIRFVPSEVRSGKPHFFQVDVLPSYWGQNLLISRTSNREQSARVMKLVGIRKSKLVTNYPNNERQYCALRPRLRPVNCLLANNQLAPNESTEDKIPQ